MRPARPVRSPRAAPRGLACTPAAHTSVWVGISVPSAKVTWLARTRATVASVRTSTPRSSSVLRAWARDDGLNGPSRSDCISTSTTRARPTSRRRKSLRSTIRNSSVRAPLHFFSITATCSPRLKNGKVQMRKNPEFISSNT